MERRLAAIVVADMVGYSRLIGQDEAGTIQRLKDDRAGLIDPAITQHGGEIIRLAGDGALIEFPSVVEAVQCAVDIQRGMEQRNADRAEHQRSVFRMGVNVGDVVIEDDNLHGEGINVAARLEALAPPGGILVTEEVARLVDGKVSAGLAFVAERTVKNIDRPVRIYQIQLTESTSRRSVLHSKRKWPWYAGAAALLTAALATVVGPKILPRQIAQEQASTKPSLIVLPFRNLSNDTSQDYFVDGVTEDLITDLSRMDRLFVISRDTAFSYRGRTATASELAKELGVRYALEGSVRRQGNRIRVSAQLIDTSSDRQLWGERYDRELNDVFAVQDDLKKEIVAALSVHFDAGKYAALTRRPTGNVEAYEFYLRARHARHQGELRSMRLTYWSLEKAIELEPNFAEALALLADTYALDYAGVAHPLDWERPPAIAKSAAEEFAHRAQLLDPTIAAPAIALAHLRLAELRFEEALPQARRAVELEPGLSDSHEVLALCLSALGHHQEALLEVNEAFRLNPKGSPSQYAARSMAQFGRGEYGAAYESMEAARTAAAVSLNWEDEALARAAAGFAGITTKFDRGGEVPPINDLQTFLALPIFSNQEDQKRLLAGLRRAGLPDFSGDGSTPGAQFFDDTQIARLLFGRTTTSFCPDLEYSASLRIAKDGQALWNLRYDISEAGEARVMDQQLCLRFPIISRGRDFCFRISPNDPPAPYSKNNSHVMNGPLLCYFTPEA